MKSCFIRIIIIMLVIPELVWADFNLSPYVGAGIGVKQHKFKSGFGDNIFRKTQPSLNAFFGFELWPSINLEINLEKTLSIKNRSNIGANNIFLGGPLHSMATFENRARYTEYGVGLFYKLNVAKIENLNLLFGGGIKSVGVKLTAKNILSTNGMYYLNKDNRKNLLTLAVGFEYMLFCKTYGLRGLINWENSSKLQPKVYKNGVLYMAKLKNSLNYTVGMVIKL